MDRLMEVTMLIQKLNAKLSTSVPLMVPEALPSTASCVPTEPFSTRTTLSVTGGLTLTALPLRSCTASMTSTLLSVMLLLVPPVTLRLTMLLPLLLKDMLPLLNTKVLDAVQADRDLSEDATTTEGDSKSERCLQHPTTLKIIIHNTYQHNKQKSQNSQDISISSQQCNVNNISAIIS